MEQEMMVLVEILHSGSNVMVRKGKGCVVVDTVSAYVEEFDNSMIPLRFSYWETMDNTQQGLKIKAKRILNSKGKQNWSKEL